jgi:hypothetical protein
LTEYYEVTGYEDTYECFIKTYSIFVGDEVEDDTYPLRLLWGTNKDCTKDDEDINPITKKEFMKKFYDKYDYYIKLFKNSHSFYLSKHSESTYYITNKSININIVVCLDLKMIAIQSNYENDCIGKEYDITSIIELLNSIKDLLEKENEE